MGGDVGRGSQWRGTKTPIFLFEYSPNPRDSRWILRIKISSCSVAPATGSPHIICWLKPHLQGLPKNLLIYRSAIENPQVLRKHNLSALSAIQIQETLLPNIRFYLCETEYFGITFYSCDLPCGINTMLRKSAPYHSNVNVSAMTKLPQPRWGDRMGSRPRHLTEYPEKGERKTS